MNLRAGTGYYSTPFRGGLFGKSQAAEVAKILAQHGGVDVLWLGTNPSVPGSLNKIINPPADDGDFPSFDRQIKSGFFGSSKWGSNGEPEADFNPIEPPNPSWRVYRDIFKIIGLDLESVATANFIPWGSKDTKALVNELGAANRHLLHRILEFADDLNIEMVLALAPKLVAVPFNLGKSNALNAAAHIGVSLKQSFETKLFTISLPEGAFNFHTALCRRGKLTVRTVFLPHPASLRLSNESKARVISEVALNLRDVQ